MGLIEKLRLKWQNIDRPFFIHGDDSLHFQDILQSEIVDLSDIQSGDVVALIGDFTPMAIQTLLRLIDLDVILVPLTSATRNDHEYFFDAAFVDVVIDNNHVSRRKHKAHHPLINELRTDRHAGLVLFSTGTTGRPKAILHDLTLFLQRFDTPRPTLRTLSFLLFDHIGGLNTLLHTLFNTGTVIAPGGRSVKEVLKVCADQAVEVLPTTPTFLRMMLMSGHIPDLVPESLKIITYGTERMDQPTLDALCDSLPWIDFRQTFGMSELGIVRVKSEARNSLFMHIGGEGVETRVVDNVLEIRSRTRMRGYLNAPSPFDEDGWYNTGDIVREKNSMYQVTGRKSEVINVGGLKFMASDVERVALQFPNIELVKATGRENPITGQHVELSAQVSAGNDIQKKDLAAYLKNHLQPHMQPKRIRIGKLDIGHRFKRK